MAVGYQGGGIRTRVGAKTYGAVIGARIQVRCINNLDINIAGGGT